MSGKGKIQIHIAAIAVIICLVGWIAMLYAQKNQREQSLENEFLTRYSAALNDVIFHLEEFEGAKSFEEQLSCLEKITIDITQLKAYMEMHVKLPTSKDMSAGINTLGWNEAETIIAFINNGGTINSYQIESFREDGIISEDEAAIIQFLKEEAKELWSDMCVLEEDGVCKYILSSAEVYQRLTELMQNGKLQLIQANTK